MADSVIKYVAMAVLPWMAACVIEGGVAGPPAAVAVTGPPPRPIEEVHVAAPATRSVWVAGYWHWTGMQYTWIPGHWDSPPVGALWRAPRYTVRDGVYYYEPGGWWRPPR